jgi:hypothetical protein
MGCLSCGSSKLPYVSLFFLMRRALADARLENVPYARIMAIMVKESSGVGYWQYPASGLSLALNRMSNITGVDENVFARAIQLPLAGTDVRYAKFRFEQSWWDESLRDPTMKNATNLERALICSSWGLGQKSAYYLTAGKDVGDRMIETKGFWMNSTYQILQIVRDLGRLGGVNMDDFAVLATRYNGPENAKEPSLYGTLANDFRVEYEKELTAGGFPLCSKNT